MLYAEWGIQLNEQDRYDGAPFIKAIQIWQTLFDGTPLPMLPNVPLSASTKRTVKKLKSGLYTDSIRELSTFLHFLGDYLSSASESNLSIMAANLHLQVQQCISPASTDGLMRVYLNLATAYHHLGYSGRAGLALMLARPLLEAPQVSHINKSKFKLIYNSHLVTLGNLQKSLQLCSQPVQVNDADGNSGVAHSLIASSHTNMLRQDYVQAVTQCMKAYRLVAKMFKRDRSGENFGI